MTNILNSVWLKRAGSAVVAYPTASLPVASQSKFLFLRVLATVFCLSVVVPAEATLFSRLDGDAAYDDVLDITWTTDANLTVAMDWADQVAWADGLDYLGFDDWRLATSSSTSPSASVFNCSVGTAGDCEASGNELGYMYYHNMDGSSDNTGTVTVDGIDLINIAANYWSGTEVNSGSAWDFDFTNGDHLTRDKDEVIPIGWAVRSGDVAAAVPEPGTVLLMAMGLVGIARRRQIH